MKSYGELRFLEGVASMAVEVGSLMHRPLSWGDDQQNM